MSHSYLILSSIFTDFLHIISQPTSFSIDNSSNQEGRNWRIILRLTISTVHISKRKIFQSTGFTHKTHHIGHYCYYYYFTLHPSHSWFFIIHCEMEFFFIFFFSLPSKRYSCQWIQIRFRDASFSSTYICCEICIFYLLQWFSMFFRSRLLPKILNVPLSKLKSSFCWKVKKKDSQKILQHI
jgi:hypothetical protein